MPELTPALRQRILQAVDAGFAAQTELTAQLVRLPSQRGEEATAQDLSLIHI